MSSPQRLSQRPVGWWHHHKTPCECVCVCVTEKERECDCVQRLPVTLNLRPTVCVCVCVCVSLGYGEPQWSSEVCVSFAASQNQTQAQRIVCVCVCRLMVNQRNRTTWVGTRMACYSGNKYVPIYQFGIFNNFSAVTEEDEVLKVQMRDRRDKNKQTEDVSFSPRLPLSLHRSLARGGRGVCLWGCVRLCVVLILAMPLSLASGWPQLRGRQGQTAAGTQRDTQRCHPVLSLFLFPLRL